MNVKAIFLLSVFPLFQGIFPLQGQTTADSLYRSVELLRLVVRLPSQEKKIRALEKSIADAGLSETARQRLQERLEQTRDGTESRNKIIITTFREHFNAMPVFFVYDTTHQPERAILLDEQLKPAGTVPATGPLIQLRFGRPRSDAGNRPESMVLTDSRLRDLGQPFPGPLMIGGLSYGIKKVLAPETAFSSLLRNRVIKLNRRLQRL